MSDSLCSRCSGGGQNESVTCAVGTVPVSKRCILKKVSTSYLLYAMCCYLQNVQGQRCNAVWVQSVVFAFERLPSEPVS